MESWGASVRVYRPERGRDGALDGELPDAESMESVAVLPGQMLGELAHDARNMVTALELYCDLLDEPGVLGDPFRHYGTELRLVAASSRRLVEKLATLDREDASERNTRARMPDVLSGQAAATARLALARPTDLLPAEPIDNLAAELEAKRNLLAALAGPTVALTVKTQGGALGVRLTREDLTRVLVNLVKNSTEAMPAGGLIEVNLDEFHAGPAQTPWLVLKVEDSGPGISPAVIGRVFEARFTTRTNGGIDGRPAPNRGLGLSITRAIVEAAGGRIHAANRAQGGARIEIELPVLTQ
jgi:signal transduction histidine kinase